MDEIPSSTWCVTCEQRVKSAQRLTWIAHGRLEPHDAYDYQYMPVGRVGSSSYRRVTVTYSYYTYESENISYRSFTPTSAHRLSLAVFSIISSTTLPRCTAFHVGDKKNNSPQNKNLMPTLLHY
jgi:hypothetical protein